MRLTEDVCGICNQTLEWHLEHRPRHSFTGPGDRASLPVLEQPPDQPQPTISEGGDPVVRAILTYKGLITEDDVKHMTKVFAEAKSTGKVILVTEGDIRLVEASALFAEMSGPPQ